MTSELKIYFHVKKSHFNKLTVEELRNVLRKQCGVKTRMRKQEMIDFLINEGVNEICLMSKDLTLPRMYQLKEMSGRHKDYGMDYGFGFVSLIHYIEDFDKEYPFASLLSFLNMTHKECEILNEMGMRGEIDNEIWERNDKEASKAREEIFDKLDTEFQKYNLYSEHFSYVDIGNWNNLLIPTKNCRYQIGDLKRKQLMEMIM